MNLSKKKALAAKTLDVGKKRIIFVGSRLGEIKEAITKQDIRDLHKEGAILIREIQGIKKKVTKKINKRSTGQIRKKVNVRKANYVIITRKLRRYVKEHKNQGNLSSEEVKEIRKNIRNHNFRSKAHLKQHIEENKK